MKLLFIDTETGGLEPGKHSLLSVALGVWEEGVIANTLDIHLVHDVYKVTNKALEINKIDLRQPRVGYTPFEANIAIIDFLQKHFGKEKATIVGQNIHFDIGFLTDLFTKERYEMYFSHRTIDTASVMRYTEMVGITSIGGSGLSDAIKYFKLHVPDDIRHTALGDIYATAAVFNELLKAGAVM